jgi:NTP pyrophosphatase (non-canonical NTP hydrolase)
MPLGSTLPELQGLLDRWIKAHGRYWAPLSQYARLAEEVGELGRELNFQYGDKPRQAKDAGGSIADELGDVLFVTMLLANDLAIDLEETLLATLKKYEERSG